MDKDAALRIVHSAACTLHQQLLEKIEDGESKADEQAECAELRIAIDRIQEEIPNQGLLSEPLASLSADPRRLVAAVQMAAQRHGVDAEILFGEKSANLLVILEKNGVKANLEARQAGQSLNVTLHEANPQGASGSDLDGLVQWFSEVAGTGEFDAAMPRMRPGCTA